MSQLRGELLKLRSGQKLPRICGNPSFKCRHGTDSSETKLVRIVYDDKGRQDVLQEGSIVTRNRAAGYYPEKELTRGDEGEDWGHIRQGELGNLSRLEGVFVPRDAQELRPLGPAALSTPTLACYGTRFPRRCISYSGRQKGDSEVSKRR